MNHNDKCLAITFIRPNAEFNLVGDELEWLDSKQSRPTEKEIKDGLIDYQAAKQAEAQAKATQRQAILDRLGITAEEAQLLLA